MQTCLATDELSQRIKYDPRTTRERLRDSVLIEGTHCVRPFGGRKILCLWETIERDMLATSSKLTIPMANGAECHGCRSQPRACSCRVSNPSQVHVVSL